VHHSSIGERQNGADAGDQFTCTDHLGDAYLMWGRDIDEEELGLNLMLFG
jgi:hypothetical protein